MYSKIYSNFGLAGFSGDKLKILVWGESPQLWVLTSPTISKSVCKVIGNIFNYTCMVL